MFVSVKVGRPGTYLASLSRGLYSVYGSLVTLLFEPGGFHVRHRLYGMGSLLQRGFNDPSFVSVVKP